MRAADFHREVLDAIHRCRMIDPGEGVVVGVSGGPDSVALLLSLAALKNTGKLRCRLHVAHLNHMLRGSEATEDARFVSRLCLRLKIRCRVEKRDVRSIAEAKKVAVEEAAREVRYQFLEDAAREMKCTRIALGHTADDNVETVLQRIIRGTGIRGLCGIPPVRPLHSGSTIGIIRPLISIWRSDVESYLRARRRGWRIDSSNLADHYLRNRIRNRLLPLLAREYNAEVKQAIARLSAIAREVTAHIEETAGKRRARLIRKDDSGIIYANARQLAALSPPVRHALFRWILTESGVPLQGVGREHFERLSRLCAQPKHKHMQLPGEFLAERKGGDVCISRKPPEPPPLGFRLHVPVPGKIVVQELGIEFQAEVFEGGLKELRQLQKRTGRYEEVIDADAVATPVELRFWKDGDRFKPLGLKGVKKVQDFFTDLKISAPMRRRIPIIACPAHPIWIVGYRIDDRVKVTSRTKRLLRLTVTSLGGPQPSPVY